VDKNGDVVKRFAPIKKPLSMKKDVEELLKA
jgi:glutathione peroxidase-family protein